MNYINVTNKRLTCTQALYELLTFSLLCPASDEHSADEGAIFFSV